MTPGRDILAAPPEEWVLHHRTRRPPAHEPYERAVGRLLRRLLRGENAVALSGGKSSDDEGRQVPHVVTLPGVDDEDRAALDRFEIPVSEEDRPPAGGLDLTAVRLPELVRLDQQWAISLGGHRSYVHLGSLDAVIIQRIVVPVISDLALVLRVRAGEGPKTDKGRAERVERCRAAHRALGLDSTAVDVLLDPELDARSVVAARAQLVHSWAEAGEEVGERAIALLCARLASSYYAKARKDGRIESARVLTQTTTPLLEATLREWPALVEYLGESLADADAAPVEVPQFELPVDPPQPVNERLAVLREWWTMYDGRHAAHQPGGRSLDGLVPRRWDYEDPSGGREPLERSALGQELGGRIEALWGWQILDRYPETLVKNPRPIGVVADLLEPAASFWDQLSLTAWYLCFGPYSRHTLDGLEDYQARDRKELATLGTPVDESVYADLKQTGGRHKWLFEHSGFGISISISIDEESGDFDLDEEEIRGGHPDGPQVFVALRDVITRHRRAWLSRYLDPYLDALWRRDLTSAAEAYWVRYRGRGKAPTLKQALPDVRDAARRWFGSDYGVLARTVGLDGPVTKSPVQSARVLPDDLPAIRAEVAEALAGYGAPTDDVRRRAWDLNRLSNVATQILVAWQATGEAAERKSVMPASFQPIVEQIFGCELDVAYPYVRDATAAALERRGHPAASALRA